MSQVQKLVAYLEQQFAEIAPPLQLVDFGEIISQSEQCKCLLLYRSYFLTVNLPEAEGSIVSIIRGEWDLSSYGKLTRGQ